MKNINIGHMGQAHTDWLRSLDFYSQELDILKKRLTELGAKNTSKEATPLIESFENRFRVQQDNLDRLQHEIHQHLNEMISDAQKSPEGFIDNGHNERHLQLNEQYAILEKVVNELRSEFNRFCAVWM